MLHQSPRGHSAELRVFGRPVLSWTLRRLVKAGVAPEHQLILAWDDQASSAADVAGELGVRVHSAGPRRGVPAIDVVRRALRWSDGWRTTLARCCAFDAGVEPTMLLELLSAHGASQLVLVDPASPLLPPQLLTGLLTHAAAHPDREWFYLPTPPGTTAALLRAGYVGELARSSRLPGSALHYHPDRYGADPVSTPSCAPAPVPLCRSLQNFRIDRPDLAETAEHAFPDGPPADAVALTSSWPSVPARPRDLRLELTTARHTRPTYIPVGPRPPEVMPTPTAVEWLEQLAWQRRGEVVGPSPTRVTLGHLGDPLLHPDWSDVLAAAAARNIPVCIETDLVGLDESQRRELAARPWDILLVHLPAASRATYARIMGVDAFDDVMAALEGLVRQSDGRLVVPLFTMLADNVTEREAWYDHFIRVLSRSGGSGGGVVQTASTWAGRVGPLGGPDLTPPGRSPCRRLSTRLTVLASGRAAACENDLDGELLAAATPGSSAEGQMASSWEIAVSRLRRRHAAGEALPSLCQTCRDFFRP